MTIQSLGSLDYLSLLYSPKAHFITYGCVWFLDEVVHKIWQFLYPPNERV